MHIVSMRKEGYLDNKTPSSNNLKLKISKSVNQNLKNKVNIVQQKHVQKHKIATSSSLWHAEWLDDTNNPIVLTS